MHLSQSPTMALESRKISPHNLANIDPETLPEREYEGRFFTERNFKNASDLNKRSIRLGRDSNPGQKLRRLLGCPLPYRGIYDSLFRMPFYINSTLYADKLLSMHQDWGDIRKG
jgi:hypothetical protein